jgi:hypothetical protein
VRKVILVVAILSEKPLKTEKLEQRVGVIIGMIRDFVLPPVKY